MTLFPTGLSTDVLHVQSGRAEKDSQCCAPVRATLAGLEQPLGYRAQKQAQPVFAGDELHGAWQIQSLISDTLVR
jgi:hypothetical protein